MDDVDRARELLRTMLLIRTFEEKVDELIKSAVIPAPTHSYVGEEAIAVGVCANLQPNDYVFSTHRNHGHCLAKGMQAWRMLAEMMGKEGAYCNGLGGDNHLGDVAKHMFGGNNIVAGGMPLATGTAYAQKYRQTGDIVACFLGDGAVNQGLFHESLNMASVLGVPVLFVLENNEYAISTHISQVNCAVPFVDRVKSYGVETEAVDGNDVEAVSRSSRRLVELVRTSQRPAFLECDTYRLGPHWTGEWGGYRPREEVAEHWKREPIGRFVEALLTRGVISKGDVAGLREEAELDVQRAVEEALRQPALGAQVLLEPAVRSEVSAR